MIYVFFLFLGYIWASSKENFWLPSFLKTVPLDKIILCSSAPYLSGSTTEETNDFISRIKNCDDFKNVNKENISVYEQFSHDEGVEPQCLNIVLELLASCLNKTPISLAHVLNSNAERFYQFESIDKLLHEK